MPMLQNAEGAEMQVFESKLVLGGEIVESGMTAESRGRAEVRADERV